MSSSTRELLSATIQESEVLAELLEAERTKLLIGIRHADHRAFRDILRHRLELVEELIKRCASTA
ncbi:MAG: hypothetical protein ABSH56_06130 [Bryobacteraceae bacterium]|jgi:hypothetical protein